MTTEHRPRHDRRPPMPPPDPVAELHDYADADCTDCHGVGVVSGQPCPACIVAVWS